MGAQRVQMKGVLPWLVRWACCAGTRNFGPALAALLAQYKIFFLHHISINLSPSPQQAGQAVVLGRLSFSMCPWRATLQPLMWCDERKKTWVKIGIVVSNTYWYKGYKSLTKDRVESQTMRDDSSFMPIPKRTFLLYDCGHDPFHFLKYKTNFHLFCYLYRSLPLTSWI